MKTPLAISIAIHYHCFDGDIANVDAPAAADTLAEFVRIGLLRQNMMTGRRKFEPTKKLEAYLTMLRAVPYPIECFVNPDSGAVVLNAGFNFSHHCNIE